MHGDIPPLERLSEIAIRIAEARKLIDILHRDFESMFPHLKGQLSARSLTLEIAKQYGVSFADLTNTARRAGVLHHARYHAAWLIRRSTDLSYSQIARIFGACDHSTVIVWEKKHQTKLDMEAANVDSRAI